MAQELGVAILELDTDQKPLIAGLASAEVRTKTAVELMQRMIDSLTDAWAREAAAAIAAGDATAAAADKATAALLKEAAAAKLASEAQGGGAIAAGARAVTGPAGGGIDERRLAETIAESIAARTPGEGAGSATPPVRVTGTGDVWGVRGPAHPGSLTNPIVMVLEAGKYAPMGSMAAAISDASMADQQGNASPVASAVELAALTNQVSELARMMAPATRLAQAGSSGLSGAGVIPSEGSTAPSTVIEDPQGAELLAQAVQALHRLEEGLGGHPVVAAALARKAAPSKRTTYVTTGMERPIDRTTVIDTTVIEDQAAGSGGALYGARGASQSTTGAPVILSGGRGGGGSNTIPVLVGGTGGSGGGNRRVDIYYHPSDSGGGGGAGGAATTGLLTRLGLGTGFAGFAGFGTALSFAGLDFAHLLTTGLGILGSAGAGLAGGGLLAAGSLGKLGVGAGSDAAVMKSTIADTQTLSKDYQNLSQAVAVYGKNSTQAAQAQAQLNFDIQTLGNTAGVKAEEGLAKASAALNTYWDLQTSGARVAAVAILQQGVTLGHEYVPLVAQAAQQNLSIINTGLKPLFAWLQGPDGIGIFHNLENLFANELPTGVHAFDQAIELVMRIVNIAAGDTGGFVTHLDELLTRWNSLSNAQLGVTIDRYVADFRLWDTFVKLLIEDIYGLFHQDVGTGNSIIQTLNAALLKLREYEQSARGQGQLTNIFMVHKTEILDLIAIIGKLGSAFASVYMAVAPAAVTAMNDIVLPIFKGLGDALAAIAKTSPVVADGLGLVLIAWKAFGTAKLLSLFGLGKTTEIAAQTAAIEANTAALAANAGAAAADAEAQLAVGGGGVAAATGIAGKAGTAVETGGFSLAAFLAGRGATGAAVGVANLGTMLGMAATTAIRIGIPALGAFLAERFVVSTTGLSHLFDNTTTVSANRVTVSSGQPKSTLPGILGSAENALISAVGGLLGLGGGSTVQVQEIGKFANYSTTQLEALIKTMRAANAVTLNGTSVPKNQLIAMAQAALDAKQKVADAVDQIDQRLNHWYLDTSRSLPALRDDFQTTMRLIATEMGTNSAKGSQEAKQNLTLFINAVIAQMAKGKISVSNGMQAINAALAQGAKLGAITAGNEWQAMFYTYTQLLDKGKIDTQTYTTDVLSTMSSGFAQIKARTTATYQSMFQNLKAEEQKGLISHGQFVAAAKALNDRLVAGSKADMTLFAQNVLSAMVQTGKVTLSGADAIAKELNQLLKGVGASQIPVPSAVGVAIQQGAGGSTPGFATGGKVNAPMYLVGEEAPGMPEYVLATNPAYRQRNLGLWSAAGRDLGVPGFFQGGVNPGAGGTGNPYVYPLPGASLGRTDEGVDGNMAPGSPIGPIGDARVMGVLPGWFQGQPLVWWELLNGPRAGQYAYVAEQITNIASGLVAANQAVARFAASGTGFEYGWATASGSTLAHATTGYSEGQVTPAGLDMRAFLAGLAHGVITGGGGGGGAQGTGQVSVPTIPTPQVKGQGKLAEAVQAGMALATKAANAYAQSHAGSGGGGPSGVGVGGTGSISASNLSAIAHALGYNWGPSEISAWEAIIGQESGGNPTAQNPTSTAYGIGQFLNSTWGSYGTSAKTSDAHLQLIDMAKYIHGRYGDPIAAEAYHLAHNSYATGGIVGAAEAAGAAAPKAGPGYTFIRNPTNDQYAILQDKSLSSHQKEVALAYLASHGGGGGGGAGRLNTAPKHTTPKKKKHKPTTSTDPLGTYKYTGPNLGENGSLPFDPSDLTPLGQVLEQLFGIAGGQGTVPSLARESDATQMSDLLAWYTGSYWTNNALYPAPNFSSAGTPSDFVISTDAAGNPITPYISPNLGTVIGELQQAVGWQSEWVSDMLSMNLGFIGLVPQVQQMIARRKKAIEAIKKRIRDNIAKIKQLKAKIAAENKLKPPYAHPKTAAETKANTDFDADRKAKIKGWNKQIGDLEADNLVLGGSKDTIGSTGELAQIQAELGTGSSGAGALNLGEGGSASGASGLYALQSNLGGWMASLAGTGGAIPTEQLDLATYQAELDALAPGAAAALAAAIASSAASSGASQVTAELNALLQQEVQTLGEELAVSQLQYEALQTLGTAPLPGFAMGGWLPGMPPWGGSFADGGIVPGPVGAARSVIAHGGEIISPPGSGMVTHHTVIVEDGAVDPRKIRVIAADELSKRDRVTARRVGRALPGRGGGVLAMR